MNYKVIPLTRDEENQLRYQHVPTVSAIEITATTPQSASVAAQPYEGPSIAYPRNPGFLQGFSHPNGSHPQAFPINTNVEAQPIILANRANPGYNQYQEPPNGLSYSKLQFMGLTRATQWCLGFIACCCCSCCIITSIVATALAYGINQNKGYLMTGYYTNSDCSGEAVYELGTRTDNCFTLGSKNSLQFIPSSQNTSIFTYQDRVCNKQIPNTTPQTISYETCEEVDDVPGLYRKSFYSKNDYVYLFYGPYVPNDGYIDNGKICIFVRKTW